jgi:hypothetical protein
MLLTMSVVRSTPETCSSLVRQHHVQIMSFFGRITLSVVQCSPQIDSPLAGHQSFRKHDRRALTTRSLSQGRTLRKHVSSSCHWLFVCESRIVGSQVCVISAPNDAHHVRCAVEPRDVFVRSAAASPSDHEFFRQHHFVCGAVQPTD